MAENPIHGAERLLSDVCSATGAELSFSGSDNGVVAVFRRDGDPPRAACEVRSLSKADRERACESVLKQLLFPEVARAAGVPESSSFEELRLKIDVASPA